MLLKAHDNKGFSLAEVIVSVAILVLVVAGFATFATMMRSMSNVKARNVAYSIITDTLTELERNPQQLPAFSPGDSIKPDDNQADGVYVIDKQITRRIDNRNDNPVNQTFTRRVIFFPVESSRQQDGTTNIENLVDDSGVIEADSNLIRLVVRVTWTDYRQQQPYTVQEESYIRRRL